MDLAVAALVLAMAAALGADDPIELRYDLKAGDHLFYRETLRREGKGPDLDFETQAEWTTHVVVTGEERGRRVVGFQRNRVAAEMVRYREKGRDRLEAERARFAARLPPPRFAEANRLTDRGEPELPWSALRESSSELLPLLHEVEVLPRAAVRVGDAWTWGGSSGLTLKAAAWEETHGRRALRVEGATPNGGAPLRYWFAPESGVVERLDFDARYPTVGATLHETLSFELVDRRRGEELRSWTADADVRQAALAALLVSDPFAVDTGWLYGLLAAGDTAFRRQVLAFAHRQRLPPPPAEMLAALLADGDPRVRALATRLRDRDEPTAPRPAFPAEPPGTTLRHMTAKGFEGWPYVVHVPEDYLGNAPFPLLLSLSGGPGRALLGLPGARDAIQRLGYLVVFPEAADSWWTPKSAAVVSALLDEVLRRFNVDTNRVYVSGSSNGGTGAFLYATLWPHRFAAAIALMGAGLFVPSGEPPLPANLAGLPILLAHGDRDPIIEKGASEDTAAEVRRTAPGARVELKIVPGRPHDIFLGSDDGLVASFAEGHVRDPFPRRVKLAMRDLAYPRRAWIEVLAKKEGVAEGEGEIGPDNGVRLETRNVERLRLLLRRELFREPGPIRVTWNGKAVFTGPLAEDAELLLRSGQASADPYLGWSMELPLGE